MAAFSFDREIERVRERIAAAPVRDFAVPHLVIDDLFTSDVVEQINVYWPGPESFQREVPGNSILQLYQHNYERITGGAGAFWSTFNETAWPAIVSSVAVAFSDPGFEVFGDLYDRHLSLDWPLTLAQADAAYCGHGEHTHFHHAPHWAFTMLLYIDPDDTCSRGTALHRVLPRSGAESSESSYWGNDLDWRTQLATKLYDEDQASLGAEYEVREYEYKCNRLFVFMDGPLALHSVPYDNADHTPNPARAENDGRSARRRVLRAHVKVHHAPFYARHSKWLPEALDPERYMKVCAPNAELSLDDRRYVETVIWPFYRERLEAYSRATTSSSQARSQGTIGRVRALLRRRSLFDQGRFTAQVLSNLP